MLTLENKLRKTHELSIATLSYSKREISPLQRVDSAEKFNVSRKMVFIFGRDEDIDTTITYR